MIEESAVGLGFASAVIEGTILPEVANPFEGDMPVAVDCVNQPDIPFETVLCHNMWCCAYEYNE